LRSHRWDWRVLPLRSVVVVGCLFRICRKVWAENFVFFFIFAFLGKEVVHARFVLLLLWGRWSERRGLGHASFSGICPDCRVSLLWSSRTTQVPVPVLSLRWRFVGNLHRSVIVKKLLPCHTHCRHAKWRRIVVSLWIPSLQTCQRRRIVVSLCEVSTWMSLFSYERWCREGWMEWLGLSGTIQSSACHIADLCFWHYFTCFSYILGKI
jgi:hypothetical protein